nr:gamma-aminobutyric acid type B receptor subunit 1 isoform X3 [Drosophila suzukii]
MRIIQPGQRTRYGQWPAVGLRLLLALAWTTAAAAAMESSAELQALGYEAIRPGAAASISTFTSTFSVSSSLPPGESTSTSTVTAGGISIPPRSDWKYKRTKVKRRQQRLNSHSNLPGSTNASHSHHILNLPPRQRYLKVNQVFEDERRMSPAEMQRNHGKIVLLGLFELSTSRGPRPDGLSELGAATMAVEHINRKRLLPGYTLELVTNDTQCDPGVGVDRFFHAIYTQPSTRMVMLLGSACSEVTESLAKVVPYWNIVQVSFGSTSPALSDRREFPYFYRTVAPDSSHNPARIAFIRKFGWGTVTTFSQNEEVHSLAVNNLVTELEAANISCAATITFAATDFKEQLLLLRFGFKFLV